MTAARRGVGFAALLAVVTGVALWWVWPEPDASRPMGVALVGSGSGNPAVPSPSAAVEPSRATVQSHLEESAERIGDAESSQAVEHNGTPVPGERAGDYRFMLALVDAGGRPIADAVARLYRGEADSLRGYPESVGESGADGLVELAGSTVGPKTLVVDARAQGFQLYRLPMPVMRGASRHTIALREGAKLQIGLQAVELRGDFEVRLGETVVWGVPLRITDALGVVICRRIAVDAQTLILGLAPGAATVELVEGDTDFSPFRMEVFASLDFVGSRTVNLKMADDARDIGHHLAEVHGTVLVRSPKSSGAVPSIDLSLHRILDGRARAAPFRLQTLSGSSEASDGDVGRYPFFVTGLDVGEYELRCIGHRSRVVIERPDQMLVGLEIEAR